MPVVSLYPNGLTAGTPPGKNDHERGKRGLVTGWSPSAVRRHTKWLYSVQMHELAASARGWAVTLTLKTCPPGPDELSALRRAWTRRMERHGIDLTHWVIEWQQRGTPHFHAAIYDQVDPGPEFGPSAAAHGLSEPLGVDLRGSASSGLGATAEPKPTPGAVVPPGGSPGIDLGVLAVLEWLDVARDYGPQLHAQDVAPITGAAGWLKYLSKHASRGVRHYQRQGMPPGWTKTGRLWGKTGEWPVGMPERNHTSMAAYWRFRRLCRSWRIADARKSGNAARISHARRVLTCNDPRLSAVRGISDWIDPVIGGMLLDLLASEGHLVIVEEASDDE